MNATPSDMISAMDVAIFAVESQSSAGDKASFLLLQNLARNFFGQYHYLEVGSHLGGTLMPHLLDPQCGSALSIDKRPSSQPDERREVFFYENNSTARMVARLQTCVPAGMLLKLRTFDGDASELETDAMPVAPHLALIDAEHTNRAAFRDFLSVYRHMAPHAIIAFHDSDLVMDAILNAQAFLDFERKANRLFFLPDRVAAIALGDLAIAGEALARSALDQEAFLTRAREWLDGVIVESVGRRKA